MSSEPEYLEKIKTDETFTAEGRTILMTGAAGNWGKHMAIGMAMVSRCSLVLCDTEDRSDDLASFKEELESYDLPGTYTILTYKEEELSDRIALLRRLTAEAGPVDSIYDTAEMNTL